MNEFTEEPSDPLADLMNLNPSQGPGLLLTLMHLSTQCACASAALPSGCEEPEDPWVGPLPTAKEQRVV